VLTILQINPKSSIGSPPGGASGVGKTTVFTRLEDGKWDHEHNVISAEPVVEGEHAGKSVAGKKVGTNQGQRFDNLAKTRGGSSKMKR